MLQTEIIQLGKRVERLIAAFHQAQLERKRALQDRDRVLAANAELKTRIEGVVQRLRQLEADTLEDSAS